MWFRNLRAYRLTQPFTVGAESLATQLAAHPFTPCGATQPTAVGWVSPLPGPDAPLVHAASGRLLVRLARQERLLPGSVVREQLAERVAAIEAREGRKVYRKERLDLRDEVVQDCLPRAFTRTQFVHALIDPAGGFIFIDAASANRAEELLNQLRESLGSFAVLLPQVSEYPLACMTHWLLNRRLPERFAGLGECELREPGDEGGVVRCRGVDLFSEEVEQHLQVGRQVTRLALTWDARVSFVLAEDLVLRRLRFADALLKENAERHGDDPLARLDADLVLMGEALSELWPQTLALFGGLAD